MAKIVITKLSSPSENGWNDVCNVVSNDELIHSEMCSASPNPFRPSDRVPWWSVYGQLAMGYEYPYSVVNHERFGESILINEGAEVISANPNPNHNGRYVLNEIFIHAANPGGASDTWRGSAGCITIPRDRWNMFIRHFHVGQSGLVVFR